jgi:hypothetical protein
VCGASFCALPQVISILSEKIFNIAVSERQFVIYIRKPFESGRRGVPLLGRCRMAAFARRQKFHFVCNDLRDGPFCSVFGVVAPGLYLADYAYPAAFGQIFSAHIAKLTPGDYVEKVGNLFACLIFEPAVNSYGKIADGNARGRRADFGVSGQIADKDRFVHIIIVLSARF